MLNAAQLGADHFIRDPDISREVRIRVPTFFWTSIFMQSLFVGEPSPPKRGRKGRDLALKHSRPTWKSDDPSGMVLPSRLALQKLQGGSAPGAAVGHLGGVEGVTRAG